MGKLEEALIFAAEKHEGQFRKVVKIPYILHPMEVAQIASTMTTDEDVIIAGLLHDVLEDTDTTSDEIKEKFGIRVLQLVLSETENKYREQDPSATWKRRKEETLRILSESDDIGITIIWAADKLSNLRALCRNKETIGDEMWSFFHQKEPAMHEWYYRQVFALIEKDLKDTEVYREYSIRLNYMWG